MSVEKVIDISISSNFHEFIPSAILRLQYIFPNIKIEVTAEGLTAFGTLEADVPKFEREVIYQIYREKIFHETLPLRQSLYQMLAL
ncbi:hypothetical protein [Paracoccus alkanivorans]|uniref:Uncharacterized protein n=1 Tax=Paracoccus alkanivorans TaxID=2116655 RepID=A0A3M0LX99_9RHOB|nr:hypothetical protein [Paracoccus alkanivorans]RMC30108.1 hypothetical protein C9E81_21980 [Paracoccus alkanivorans]